jgi:hypothetical protein
MIPLNNVDQLIHQNILPGQDTGACDFVLMQNLRGQYIRLGSQLCERESLDKLHSTHFLLFVNNVRRMLIESDTDRFEFFPQDFSMSIGTLFSCIQHNENGIGGTSHCNDLSTMALSMRGTFDDSWEIQHLNLGTLVPHGSRNTRESRKLICGL